MAEKATYFQIHELTCKHTFDKYGEKSWQFLDPRLVLTLDFIRGEFNKPIEINNYYWGGHDTQSGLRCNLCTLVKKKTDAGKLYLSAHIQGMAADFSVKGMTANAVRTWLKQHEDRLPYPIRLEDGVNWVHIDVRQCNNEKVYIFNP